MCPADDSDQQQQQQLCWICHSGSEAGDLVQPCRCPRSAHPACLGRWQLQCAGKSEERRCRFCSSVLPPLAETLTPPHLRQVEAETFIAVVYRGQSCILPIRPGIDGLAEFRARVKCYFGLPYDAELNITFECIVPYSGERLALTGLQCFDAVATCAAINAAKRAAGEDAGFVWDMGTGVEAAEATVGTQPLLPQQLPYQQQQRPQQSSATEPRESMQQGLWHPQDNSCYHNRQRQELPEQRQRSVPAGPLTGSDVASRLHGALQRLERFVQLRTSWEDNVGCGGKTMTSSE